MFKLSKPIYLPIIVGFSVITLSGCTFFGAPQTPPPPPEPDETFSITGQEDDTAFTLGTQLPNTWPDNLPTPINSTVAFTTTTADETTGKVTHQATFSTTGSTEQVFNQLKVAYQLAGWLIKNEITATSNVVAAGFEGTQDNDEVGVSIVTDPANNQASVTIIGEFLP